MRNHFFLSFATHWSNKCFQKYLPLFFVHMGHSLNIEANLLNILSTSVFAYSQRWMSSQLAQKCIITLIKMNYYELYQFASYSISLMGKFNLKIFFPWTVVSWNKLLSGCFLYHYKLVKSANATLLPAVTFQCPEPSFFNIINPRQNY